MNKTQDISLIVGNNLKKLRNEIDLSQEQFSEFIGISQAQYSKYERGVQEISIAKIIEICEKLKISPTYFFDDLANYIKTKPKPGFASSQRPDNNLRRRKDD